VTRVIALAAASVPAPLVVAPDLTPGVAAYAGFRSS